MGLVLEWYRRMLMGGLAVYVTSKIFKYLAQVCEESEAAVRQWRSNSKTPWSLKFWRSCHPLKVQVGQYYHADKGLVLTILDIIANSTASLVLTYKSG